MRTTATLIYRQLVEFVQSSKILFGILPKNDELEILGQYFPLRVEANIFILGEEAYYFMVSQNGGFIRRGERSVSLMSLKAKGKTWLQILNGHKSLIQEYNRGTVEMSNARANFLYKLTLLSIFFESRNRIVRAGRILKIIPIAIIRAVIAKMLKIMPNILNYSPSVFLQSLINWASQFSYRFER